LSYAENTAAYVSRPLHSVHNLHCGQFLIRWYDLSEMFKVNSFGTNGRAYAIS